MRSLRKDARVYTFAWNSASKQDWKKIQKIFIAAFMDSYKNVPMPNLKTSFSEYFKVYFEGEYHEIMKQDQAKKIDYLVTYFEDEPVAFFTAEHNWKTARAYLRLATVSPQFYRQGIGKFAMEEICRHFNTNGRIELIVRPQNLDGVAFYRAYGMKEVTEFDFNEPNDSVGYKAMVRSYFNKPDVMRPPADDEFTEPGKFVGFKI